MTTAILDDPFPICGQVSGSFRALEVCVRISLAIASQVLEHQKLSCHLSQLKALAWCILHAGGIPLLHCCSTNQACDFA